jgi:hypothetical protein
MKKNIIIIIIITIILSIIPLSSFSQKMKESYYRDGFAEIMNGKTEVVLNDLAKVDIVTDTFVIEVEFADRWSEGVGQSLYYAYKLNKKPGVLLIVEGLKDDAYVKRLMTVAIKYDITVWVLNYNTDKWKKVELIYSY